MPYGRRRNNTNTDEGGVKGPSSALTSFLREQGISAEQIRLRYEQSKRQKEPGGTTEVESGVEIPVEEVTNRDLEIKINTGLDSDEEEVDYEKPLSKRQRLEQTVNVSSGTDLYCMECDQDFTISVYSKKMERDGKIGYLCPSCSKIQIRRERLAKRHEIEARRRRKKIAAALLDKKQFKLPSLQDFCINVITENINSVEALGEIGTHNKMKICRILAKNRSLNNKTISLFLDGNTKKLEFWDCSKIDKNSLDKIAVYCPNLESLTLNMCGQLHNDNLQYFGSKLNNLKSFHLNGPFLINDNAWQSFFESKVGKNLKQFTLINTHRFSNDSLVCLLENCGNNLESLTLSRLDSLDSKPVFDLLPHFLSSLKHLEISYPHSKNLIDDDLIINLLAVNCDSLESLNLDRCSDLTDRFLTEGLKPFGSHIRKLSLTDLDQIDDAGVGVLFDDWKINGGLTDINLERCTLLTDDSIYKMLSHSSETLVRLKLNSVKLISKSLFSKLSRNTTFPLLTFLDLGFVRSVDDSVLAMLSRICPKLEILEVYGNNRCTERALIRENLTVIGRQTDSI